MASVVQGGHYFWQLLNGNIFSHTQFFALFCPPTLSLSAWTCQHAVHTIDSCTRCSRVYAPEWMDLTKTFVSGEKVSWRTQFEDWLCPLIFCKQWNPIGKFRLCGLHLVHLQSDVRCFVQTEVHCLKPPGMRCSVFNLFVFFQLDVVSNQFT